MWEWCNPAVLTMSSTSTPSVTRNIENSPSNIERIGREDYNSRLQVVEANMAMMKLVVVASFILSIDRKSVV